MNDTYRQLPPLVDSSLVERAARLSTAALCDGMKGLGIERDGCMDAAIMPVDESMRMVGTAATVETAVGDNFPIHVAIYQCKPGYVLLVDGKAYTERAYLGDLMGGSAKAVGIEGVVIDGFVRDKVGLKEIGLPVYARGFMQRTPDKIGPGTINMPIQCGGLRVNPGDLVVGDHDGVTVIPRDKIEAVLDAAESKNAYEEQRRDSIVEYERARKAGEPLPPLAPQWVVTMLQEQA